MGPQNEFLFVTKEEAGERVDCVLAQRFPECSRTYFQNLIEQGLVLVNGQTVKKRVLLEEGNEIEVCFQALPQLTLAPESIPLDILYEDEFLLAINKPAGMVVHPAPGHWSGTFVNALLAHCQGLVPGKDPLRPGIVHRLDRGTSGVLIAAKTIETQQKLIELFAERAVEKFYLGICVGHPSNGTICAPIGRHPTQRQEMAILEKGKAAESKIQVLAFQQQISLLLIQPLTGRTHQIRVHLKHVGSPILGDFLYGNPRINQSHGVERPLLHAYRLNLVHPITGTTLKLSAPLPPDFQSWMERIARSADLCQTALPA